MQKCKHTRILSTRKNIVDSSLRSRLCVLSLTPLNLNGGDWSLFSACRRLPVSSRFAVFSVAPASSVIVRLINRFSVGLWCSHLFLGAFIGWWCSVEIPSWRSHGCAFCPHDIMSSCLLCSALCFGRRVLCASCSPRLHGHVLQHCVCVSFVPVRAWLLMIFATKLGWCHVPVRPGDVSTASPWRFQSSVRTALLQLSSDSMTICVLG